MVARLLRLLLLFQVLAAAGAAYGAHTVWGIAPAPALALGAGAVLLARLVLTAQNFVLSRRDGSDLAVHERLGWRRQLRMVATEFGATMAASSWNMARPGSRRRLYQAGQASPLPVLLIHGYGCNSGYWAHLVALLDAARISHDALDLEPVMAGIDDHAVAVARAVEALCSATGCGQVIIVAHSMGGLVARAYLRACGSARVARVITLGTPHHGTRLARFAIGSNGAQMRRSGRLAASTGSTWLRALGAAETAQTRALFTSIYSNHDNIIAPQSSCHLPGAKNIEFAGIGHVALGRDRRVLQCVLDEIVRAGSMCPSSPK
jgi:pimeloyl-ACP methyl ester carboxylesterase